MKDLSIGYQGIEGSYSSQAVEQLFAKSDSLGYDLFEQVLDDLDQGKLDVAVLPSDNTVIGSIYEIYDLLFKHPEIVIVGETMVGIQHKLMYIQTKDKPKQRLSQITQIYSHPKALAQCHTWLKNHPQIEAVFHADTAGAAAMISQEQDLSLAAIASKQASQIYDLQIHPEEIQDDKANFTRFLALCKQSKSDQVLRQMRSNQESVYKTSIVFVATHEPGSLMACMQPFAQAGLNLTKIESRPLVGQAWEYLFFLDFEHTDTNGNLTQILDQVRPHTQMLRNLGTYKSIKHTTD